MWNEEERNRRHGQGRPGAARAGAVRNVRVGSGEDGKVKIGMAGVDRTGRGSTGMVGIESVRQEMESQERNG